MGEQKSDKEVELAYRTARKLAKSLINTYSGAMPTTMDFEDFVQEGVLAWLQHQPMMMAMIRAFRNEMKLSPYEYKVKKRPIPQEVNAEDVVLSCDPRSEIEDQLDAAKVLDKIYEIKDEQVQFAVVGYLYFGLTLREIGEVLGKSYVWVLTGIIRPELARIKEELGC